ncbi:hypothetical protein [Nonomuraea indica]|uniref:DUF222 domain-containing protein n=1 Tax=Nonomuraea indica TaxID=1581193 RepID=A0ABW8AGB1_9ACTN
MKHNIHIRGKDQDFVKVMASALRAIRDQEADFATGKLMLGLVAGGPTNELAELREVTEMARAMSDHASLNALLSENVTNTRTRARYGHVVAAVAADPTVQSEDEAAIFTHKILSALHVLQVDLGPDGRDTRSEIDSLAAAFPGQGNAVDIFAHLYELAQEYGPRAGQVNVQSLKRALQSRFGLQLGQCSPELVHKDSNEHNPTGISVTTHGSGPTWVAESQTFHNLDFRNL